MRFLSLVILCCIFISCKKENNPIVHSTNSSSYRSKFIDTLDNSVNSSSPLFACNTQASNYFYIIQKQNNGNYLLYKTDAEINSLYTKTLNIGTDSIMSTKGSRVSDDFYTLSSTYNFATTQGTVINAYVYTGNPGHDSLTPCNSPPQYYFSFDPSLNTGSEKNLQNNSTLRKFDGTGALSWVKILDGNYHTGNSIETDLLGNTYVLTATRAGYAPRANTQYTQGLIPYFNYLLDSNQFSLYKFDINGVQIFKKTFPNVYDPNPGQFNPKLSVSANQITVSSPGDIFIFNLSGTLLTSIKPVTNSCYNYLISNIANVHQPNSLLHGFLNYENGGTNNKRYLVKSTQGIFGLPMIVNPVPEITIMDGNGLCYSANNTSTLEKFDSFGNLLYSKILYNVPFSFQTNIHNSVTDKFENLYVFELRNSQILSYKLDAYGDFQ